MCLEERNTDSRGRSSRRESERRTRSLRLSNCVILRSMCGLLLLAFLAKDIFTLIANTFALIGLGRACRPNLGRHLPNLLLVDPGYGNDFLLRPADLHLDARGDLVHHLVAEADLHLQPILALHRRAEADAVDLERLRITLGDALNQVDDLGPRHAP